MGEFAFAILVVRHSICHQLDGGKPIRSFTNCTLWAVLLLSGFAYTILQSCIIAAHGGKNSLLAKAVAQDRKGKASLALYVTAIALAFWHVWVADGIYVLVAIMWLIPDSRIEKALEK
jgi:uncharacterized membrane protein